MACGIYQARDWLRKRFCIANITSEINSGVDSSKVGGGGGHIHIIVVCTIIIFLKSIFFTVYEHEYINMSPPPHTDPGLR